MTGDADRQHEFQQVVAKVQKYVEASFEKFLPGAFAGWEAGEIESQSWTQTSDEFAGNMTNLSRDYRSGDKLITINLNNWPHWRNASV